MIENAGRVISTSSIPSARAYYNENDKDAAAWLRELIAAGLIAPGDVDERSIEDVQATDLVGYTQHHFFAGIGLWSLALRRAGWRDEWPVWTGSLPCQPFSVAGKGAGFDDDRNLWPIFFALARIHRPDRILGEQSSSKLALAWLDVVSADLEGEGYAVGAVDTCAAGFGAPHWRQRLYWVADASGARRDGPEPEPEGVARDEARLRLPSSFGGPDGLAYTAGSQLQGDSGRALRMDGGREALRPSERKAGAVLGGSDGQALRLGDPRSARLAGRSGIRSDDGTERQAVERTGGDAVVLADADVPGRDGRTEDAGREERRGAGIAERSGLVRAGEDASVPHAEGMERPGPVNGLWRDADWLACRDGKWRPVEGGTFPLAPTRAAVGSVESRSRTIGLKGAGNALNLAQAEEFVRAYMALGSTHQGAEQK